MKNLCLLLMMFLTSLAFSQDQLFKKDNTKLEVKILEINPTEIKYKLFSYQDGPLIIVNKSEVAMIIYQNGVHEVITTPTPTIVVTQPMYTDMYDYRDKKRKDAANEKKEKYKALTVHKNVVGINAFEFANGGIGLSYLREFTPYLSVYTPIYIGFAQPILNQTTHTSFNYGTISNYTFNRKTIEVGLGVNIQTSGERAVSHFIGPLISMAQYTGNYNLSQNTSYYGSPNPNPYNTKSFVLNRTSLMINNGLLFRINPRFNIIANIAIGVHIDNYISGNDNNILNAYNNFSGLPFNTFKAGLTIGYRF